MPDNQKPEYKISLPRNASLMDMWRATFPVLVDMADKPSAKYFIEIVSALNTGKMSVGALLGMTPMSFAQMRSAKESDLRIANPTFTDEQIKQELAHWESGMSWAHEYLYRNNSSLISVQTKVPCPDFLPLHANQVRGNKAVGEDKMQDAIGDAMKRILGKPSLMGRICGWWKKRFG